MVKRVEMTWARRVHPWNVFKIALALSLLCIVLWNVRWEEVLALWRRMVLVWLIPSIAIFFGMAWLNARRYWLLIGGRPSFHSVLNIVIFQTALTNLVATVAGTAWYVTLLKTRYQIELKSSVASVVLARLSDLMVLVPMLMVCSIAVWPQIDALHGFIVFSVFGSVCLVLGVFAVLIGRQQVVKVLNALARRLGIQEKVWVLRILDALDELARIEPAHTREILRVALLYGCFILGLSLLFSYVNVQLFALELSLPALMFVAVVSLFISYVPIQVFGGLGIFEVTTLILYTMFGLPSAEILAFVISARLYSWLLNGLLLLYPLLTSRGEH